mmetsp:Transcript_11959/g.34581  ORF Transcript_11959/g.34581 Transcript_11959/m.34581 type:complete len:209 (-) Transcript_11959:2611-3237(-)
MQNPVDAVPSLHMACLRRFCNCFRSSWLNGLLWPQCKFMKDPIPPSGFRCKFFQLASTCCGDDKRATMYSKVPMQKAISCFTFSSDASPLLPSAMSLIFSTTSGMGFGWTTDSLSCCSYPGGRESKSLGMTGSFGNDWSGMVAPVLAATRSSSASATDWPPYVSVEASHATFTSKPPRTAMPRADPHMPSQQPRIFQIRSNEVSPPGD